MGVEAWAVVLALLVTAGVKTPPEKVVLEGKLYRAVTVDHRAHLSRRIACRSCHGDGVVTHTGHLGMTAGHERCRGCHAEKKRGPVECRGCHTGPARRAS
jgi:DnaJ-class molecular chaperone